MLHKYHLECGARRHVGDSVNIEDKRFTVLMAWILQKVVMATLDLQFAFLLYPFFTWQRCSCAFIFSPIFHYEFNYAFFFFITQAVTDAFSSTLSFMLDLQDDICFCFL